MTLGIALVALAGGLVASGTSITLSALGYARWREKQDEDEDRRAADNEALASRCPEIDVWLVDGNERRPMSHRCTLNAGHHGPCRVPHPNEESKDYWWQPTKKDAQ